MSEVSLRERSKERRRRAIQMAGMRLFAERGFDQTTVADVAAEAEVAPRTVSLYFTSKRTLALSSSDLSAERLTQALQRATPGASVVDTVVSWLRAEAEGADEEEWHLRAAMLQANPLLAAAGTEATESLARTTGTALAAEFGVPQEHPAIPVTVGGMAGVMTQYALLPSPRQDSGLALASVRHALTGLVEGVRSGLVSGS